MRSIPTSAVSLVSALLKCSEGFDSQVKGKPKAFPTPPDPVGPTPLTSGTSFHIILPHLAPIQPSFAHPRTQRVHLHSRVLLLAVSLNPSGWLPQLLNLSPCNFSERPCLCTLFNSDLPHIFSKSHAPCSSLIPDRLAERKGYLR